jgi:hypothetical protein
MANTSSKMNRLKNIKFKTYNNEIYISVGIDAVHISKIRNEIEKDEKLANPV